MPKGNNFEGGKGCWVFWLMVSVPHGKEGMVGQSHSHSRDTEKVLLYQLALSSPPFYFTGLSAYKMAVPMLEAGLSLWLIFSRNTLNL